MESGSLLWGSVVVLFFLLFFPFFFSLFDLGQKVSELLCGANGTETDAALRIDILMCPIFSYSRLGSNRKERIKEIKKQDLLKPLFSSSTFSAPLRGSGLPWTRCFSSVFRLNLLCHARVCMRSCLCSPDRRGGGWTKTSFSQHYECSPPLQSIPHISVSLFSSASYATQIPQCTAYECEIYMLIMFSFCQRSEIDVNLL